MKYDYLVIGAGLSGCVFAERIATQLDKKVLLIDSRNHIGGNCYDYVGDEGIIVHKYGPHIFHTNNQRVWDYLSQFTDWTLYFHRVLAFVDGINIPVPFNLNSLYKVFPPNFASKLENLLIQTYSYGSKIPILKLMQTESKELKMLADYVYRNIFLGYNIKQWNSKPEDLDFSVSARVPIYISRDDRYFQDMFQAIPAKGYTKLFENMLKHPNIELALNTDYKSINNMEQYEKVIHTGKIDEYFDFMYGELPYRSLKFGFEYKNTEFYQSVSQLNYPSNFDFTRITEFKHFLNQNTKGTIIAKEYPMQHIIGKNDPYYPIPNDANQEIFEKYAVEANHIRRKVIFAGRLADYKYYNMDQVIGVAMAKFTEMCKNS